MKNSDFIIKEKYNFPVSSGKTAWKTPSNIALVKYWGKEDPQLPKNASVSFTLDACNTKTVLSFSRRTNSTDGMQLEVVFEGVQKDSFRPKINTFFKRIEAYVPFINDFNFKIESWNSFPHSSGIASSASGMGALALCIMDMEKLLYPEMEDTYFARKASFLARLGSGSACRSIEGDLVVWGEDKAIPGSSDLYGVKFPFEVHTVFKNFHDTILLVDEGEKLVSSTVGHKLMHNHPFAEQRFNQASEHMGALSSVLQEGAIDRFIEIVEREALSLHAMMMTSAPYFILMKPNTLKIINKIWDFRRESGLHLCFTLDAGANVHLLYPEQEKEMVNKFVIKELVQYCQENHYICDRVGSGAKRLAIP